MQMCHNYKIAVSCTQNGSYCENEKIRGGGGNQGGCVQRMEVIVKRKKMKKTKHYRHSGRVGEAFETIKNIFIFIFFFIFFFFWGGGVRELKGDVKLL